MNKALIFLLASIAFGQTKIDIDKQTKGSLPISRISGSVTPIRIASTYNFTGVRPSPPVDLIIGSTLINLAPVPAGVNWNDGSNDHKVYITGGTDPAGTCYIVSAGPGTAVAGAASGTLTLNCTGNHRGAYTIQSASGGAGEAFCSLPAAGGEVNVSTPITLYADVTNCGKTNARFKKLAGVSMSGAFKILGVGNIVSPDTAESSIGTQVFYPNINQAAGTGGFTIEPIMTTGNTSIVYALYVEQMDKTKMSSDDYLNGIGVNITTSNPGPSQNAGIMSFMYGTGGADLFGIDVAGISASDATVAPTYIIGAQVSANAHGNGVSYAGTNIWPLLVSCASDRTPKQQCGSMIRLQTGVGVGSAWLMTVDANVMTGQGILLTPANDSNADYAGIQFTDMSGTDIRFIARKSGLVQGKYIVAGGSGVNTATYGGIPLVVAGDPDGILRSVFVQPKSADKGPEVWVAPSGTSAHSGLKLFRTSDVGTNTESLFVGGQNNFANTFEIGVAKAGGGTLRPLIFSMGGAEVMRVNTDNKVWVPGIKSTTGQRYVCVGTSGELVSSTAACSGT